MICKKKMLTFILAGSVSLFIGCGVTPKSAAAEACGCMVLALESEADDWEDEMNECGKMSLKFQEKFSANKQELKQYKEVVLQCSEEPLKDKKWKGAPPI